MRRYKELEASGASIESASAVMAIIWPGYFSDAGAAPPAPQILCDPNVNEAVMHDAIRLLQERVL